ncbi:hypothetical protein CGMCC3_g10868 [Colletotrichum fructicola]|nr:uncharacterized protein CGMCC3_g10868 [Colletotrichum fructicola]KAE9573125.1 hypothetical protein CGMCC3_g10868 [Colletotrichum fructicola]
MDTNTSPKSFRYSFLQLTTDIPLKWIKSNHAENSGVLTPIGGSTAFISSVIVANIPQLYLSFWYLAYNALITRLEMSREWDNFSLGFCPLRVTQPKGEQISTYRLQLPYKYNIPLIASSTLAHWLLSNTLFIMVSQGSYYQVDPLWFGYLNDPISLPADATVGIGTAAMPLLILAILG